jgi:hypothetical protein
MLELSGIEKGICSVLYSSEGDQWDTAVKEIGGLQL